MPSLLKASICYLVGHPQCHHRLRSGGQPLLLSLRQLKEVVIKPHIKEPLGRNDIVAILQMVAGIKRICHNQHIVIFCRCSHCVITDYNPPMSAHFHIFHNNGLLPSVALLVYSPIRWLDCSNTRIVRIGHSVLNWAGALRKLHIRLFWCFQ